MIDPGGPWHHHPGMKRARARILIALGALALGGCDLFHQEPGSLEFPLPDKPEDPRACAGPGTDIGLDGETIPEVFMRASDPDLACSGEWLVESYLSATWTLEISTGWDMIGQIAAHPEGGLVLVQRGTLMRIDGEGEVLWSNTEIPEDAENHVVRVDEQGRIFAAARIGEYMQILVLDSQGQLLDVFELGEFGRSGHGHFSFFEGDLLIAGFNEGGAVLLRATTSGELVSEHALEQAVRSPFVHVDGTGTLFYGDGPSRLLESDGHLIAQLDEITDVDGTWIDAHRHVAPRELGFLLAQTYESQLGVRAIDGEGGTQWIGQRVRGEFASWQRAVASTPEGGGVVVGSEVFDSSLEGYDAFISFTQPLIVGFDAQGELQWVDRIAIGGEASDVVVGAASEVYVSGRGEFRGSDDDDLRPVEWLRRYDPPK
jgi:hypothetical protein